MMTITERETEQQDSSLSKSQFVLSQEQLKKNMDFVWAYVTNASIFF